MSIGRVPGATGIQPSIVDAKGDLIVATAADSVDRLAVGTNGQALLADSTTATGLKWGAVGKILQVVSVGVAASRSTSSSTYVDISGATASITPSSSSNKVLVFVNAPGAYASSTDGGTCYGLINLVRGTTDLSAALSGWYIVGGTGGRSIGDIYTGANIIYMDSPATTSSTTYKLQFRLAAAGNVFYATDSVTRPISLVLMEVAA